ncbi:hypothetical protein L1049_026609 [Liquidambar formosana]|uniref:Uncharacterized protein n=1 Tax=Liquidambar formosana TaxID=63359 RepID=A0AAP0R912_LIQFO
MGACFSSDEQSFCVPTAKVISVAGDLREYSLPFTASEVLQMESSSDSSACFVCNSDRLYYDDYIPALHPEDPLQPGQIYFLLPNSKLQYRLSASDMAALAVKASLALQNSSLKGGRRRKKARISPLLLGAEIHRQPPNKKPPPVISRSGSVRKLHRYSSKGAKMAVRSFRLRLTTIYEGSVL